MFLTVAEFSKLAGVSKKKIYDDWNTRLQGYTKTQSGTKMIDEEALKIYRPIVVSNNDTAEAQEERVGPINDTTQEADKETQGNNSTTQDTTKKSANDILIEELREIIRGKEAEIRDLKAQAEETQKKLDAKDEQIREDTKRFTETIQGQLVIIGRQQERLLLLEAPQEEKKKHKGIFARLFGKKDKGDSL